MRAVVFCCRRAAGEQASQFPIQSDDQGSGPMTVQQPGVRQGAQPDLRLAER